jgi:HEAT repeat protein
LTPLGRPAFLTLLAIALPVLAASPVDAAIRALQHDPSLKVRTQAAVVLGQSGSLLAMPLLRQALVGDHSAAVRIAAAGALGRLHARAARPTLLAARESDPDQAVRSAASKALDALGPVAAIVDEPAGTPAARDAVWTSLSSRLRELGFAVGEPGELRLKPTVAVDLGGSAVAATISLLILDGDGHVETMEGSARATLTGTLTEERRAATSARVVDTATRGVCQNLASKRGQR